VRVRQRRERCRVRPRRPLPQAVEPPHRVREARHTHPRKRALAHYAIADHSSVSHGNTGGLNGQISGKRDGTAKAHNFVSESCMCVETSTAALSVGRRPPPPPLLICRQATCSFCLLPSVMRCYVGTPAPSGTTLSEPLPSSDDSGRHQLRWTLQGRTGAATGAAGLGYLGAAAGSAAAVVQAGCGSSHARTANASPTGASSSLRESAVKAYNRLRQCMRAHVCVCVYFLLLPEVV
jgi:hypothetical protein